MDTLPPIAETLADIADPMALLEGLFACAPVAIEVFDRDGRCLLQNRAVADLFGSALPEGYNILQDNVAEAAGYSDLIRRAFGGETLRLPPLWCSPKGGWRQRFASDPAGERFAKAFGLT